MREVLIALAGVIVGVAAESIAYAFRNKSDKLSDRIDNAVDLLIELEFAYDHNVSYSEINMLAERCRHALLRALRIRNAFFQKSENRDILQEFSSILAHHTSKKVEVDILGDGKTFFQEDHHATRQEIARKLAVFTAKIERLNPHF